MFVKEEGYVILKNSELRFARMDTSTFVWQGILGYFHSQCGTFQGLLVICRIRTSHPRPPPSKNCFKKHHILSFQIYEAEFKQREFFLEIRNEEWDSRVNVNQYLYFIEVIISLG